MQESTGARNYTYALEVDGGSKDDRCSTGLGLWGKDLFSKLVDEFWVPSGTESRCALQQR